MYQAAIEGLLGLRREAATFRIDPCIPAMWPRYAVDWRIGRTVYRITVANPENRCRGVQSAEIDGRPVDPAAIPLRDDEGVHDVAVVLGKAGPVGADAQASARQARNAS
jgi:cellobiose phosphorylase